MCYNELNKLQRKVIKGKCIKAILKENKKKEKSFLVEVIEIIVIAAVLAQEETKKRIFEIAEELEYEVRAQKKRRRKLKIGVFYSYSPEEELQDPYYLCIRLAIEKKLEEEGYTCQ